MVARCRRSRLTCSSAGRVLSSGQALERRSNAIARGPTCMSCPWGQLSREPPTGGSTSPHMRTGRRLSLRSLSTLRTHTSGVLALGSAIGLQRALLAQKLPNLSRSTLAASSRSHYVRGKRDIRLPPHDPVARHPLAALQRVGVVVIAGPGSVCLRVGVRAGSAHAVLARCACAATKAWSLGHFPTSVCARRSGSNSHPMGRAGRSSPSSPTIMPG